MSAAAGGAGAGAGAGDNGGRRRRWELPRQAQGRGPSGYVGILNQGATCYLNSLLQMMFLTPELKAALYGLAPEELGLTEEDLTPIPVEGEGEGEEEGGVPVPDAIPCAHLFQSDNSDVAAEDRGRGHAGRRRRYPRGDSVADAESEGVDGSDGAGGDGGEKEDEEDEEEVVVDSESMEMMLGMGFSDAQIRAAYRRYPGPDAAESRINFILEGGAEVTSRSGGRRDRKRTPIRPSFGPPSAGRRLGHKPVVAASSSLPVSDSSSDDDSMSGDFDLFGGGLGDSGSGSGSGSGGSGSGSGSDDDMLSNLLFSDAVVSAPQPVDDHDDDHDDASQSDDQPAEPEPVDDAKPEPVDDAEPEPVDDAVDDAEPAENPKKTSDVAPTPDDAASDDASDDAASGDAASGAAAAVSERKATPTLKILLQLQALFAEMQLRNARAVSTRALTRRGFQWVNAESMQQHDIQELNRILFDAIEQQLVRTQADNIVRQLYQGTTLNRIICQTCGNTRDRPESFLDIVVPVASFASLPDALASAFDYELMEGDNQISCPSCESKQDAKMGAKLQDLPPVLVCMLSRFEYDWAVDRRVKIDSPFAYPLVLDMAPYTVQGADLDPSAASPPVSDGPSLYQGPVHPDSDALYDLAGVVIHSGGAYGGHYHAYLHDTAAADAVATDPASLPPFTDDPGLEAARLAGASNLSSWLDFNDSTVTPIPVSKLAEQYGSPTATESGYMLIYRSRSSVPDARAIAASPAVTPPPFLASVIASKDYRYDAVRAEYAEMQHFNEIVVHSAANYVLYDGVLTPISRRADKLPPDNASQRFDIDLRTTMGDLRSTLKEAFGPAIPGTPEDMLIHIVGSRLGSLLLTPLTAPPEMTLEDAGLVLDDMVFLAWDGTLPDGSVWDHAEEKIAVDTIFYSDPLDATVHLTFPFRFYENVSLEDAQAALASSPEVLAALGGAIIPDPQSLLLSRLDSSGAYTLNGAFPTLAAGRIFDIGNKLTVELIPQDESVSAARGGSTLAQAHYYEKQFMLDITIVDTLSIGFPSATYALTVKKTMRIDELKALIFTQHVNPEKLPPNGPWHAPSALDYMRLVRTSGWGSSGNQFASENLSLQDAHIIDGERITLEEGIPPNPNRLAIRFVLGAPDGSHISNILTCHCVKQDSLKSAKALMASYVDRDPAFVRLRETDIWDLPAALFADEDLSLEDAKVRDDDLLWMEEGRPPLPGAMILNIELYSPPNIDDPTPDDDGKKAGEKEEEEETDIVSSMIAKSRKITTARADENPDAALVSPLLRAGYGSDENRFISFGEIEVSAFDSIRVLTKQVAPLFSRANNDCTSIRVWNINHPRRLLTAPPLPTEPVGEDAPEDHMESTLGALQLMDGQSITLEIVPPITNQSISPTAMILYVHLRNPEARAWASVQELHFDAGLTPSLSDLCAFLSQALDIPEDALFVAKHDIVSGVWRLLAKGTNLGDDLDGTATTPDQEEGGDDEPEAEGVEKEDDDGGAEVDPVSGNKKIPTGNPGSNIRERPFAFSHGDILGVKDMRADPAENDNFVTAFMSSGLIAPSTTSYAGDYRATEVQLRIPVD